MSEFRCPGCDKDMTDFVRHEAHYADDEDLRVPNGNLGTTWPWTGLQTGSNALGSVCPWTRDYLSAEWLRRHPQPWSYA